MAVSGFNIFRNFAILTCPLEKILKNFTIKLSVKVDVYVVGIMCLQKHERDKPVDHNCMVLVMGVIYL